MLCGVSSPAHIDYVATSFVFACLALSILWKVTVHGEVEPPPSPAKKRGEIPDRKEVYRWNEESVQNPFVGRRNLCFSKVVHTSATRSKNGVSRKSSQ